jgi:hypothetical protein
MNNLRNKNHNKFDNEIVNYIKTNNNTYIYNSIIIFNFYYYIGYPIINDCKYDELVYYYNNK